MHRNLLMQCNQLPEDVFKKTPEKKRDRKVIGKRKKKQAVVDEGVDLHSKDELYGLLVEIPVGVVPVDPEGTEAESDVEAGNDLSTLHGEESSVLEADSAEEGDDAVDFTYVQDVDKGQ